MRSITRIAVLLTAAACLVFGQDADLAARLDRVLRAHQEYRKFMGAALGAKDGKVLLEKGYGMANLELDLPNRPNTKFRLGSITKQFTSTPILQPEKHGKHATSYLPCNYLDTWTNALHTITR